MAYWHHNLNRYVVDSDSDDGTYGASSKIVNPRRIKDMPFTDPTPPPPVVINPFGENGFLPLGGGPHLAIIYHLVNLIHEL